MNWLLQPRKKDAEVTANRAQELLVDYALATKDVLGITKATSNKLKQNEKSMYHTTYSTLKTDKLNLASPTSCISSLHLKEDTARKHREGQQTLQKWSNCFKKFKRPETMIWRENWERLDQVLP